MFVLVSSLSARYLFHRSRLKLEGRAAPRRRRSLGLLYGSIASYVLRHRDAGHSPTGGRGIPRLVPQTHTSSLDERRSRVCDQTWHEAEEEEAV